MKYTRYDIKRKNKSNYFSSVILIAVLFLAVLIVTVLAPILFKNSNQIKTINIQKKEDDIDKYIIVQCGSFQKRENASALQSALSNTAGNSFIIEDKGICRVVCGIFTEKDGTNFIKNLSDKKVENSKMTFAIKNEDLCNKEIGELINANLQILNKLSDNSIKSIGTDDLKKWTSNLKEVDKKSKNYKIEQELKNHNNNYPKELSKANVEENYKFIYNTLKEIK